MSAGTGGYDPEAHAASLGLAVRAYLLPPGRWAVYLPARRLILVRAGMRTVLRRWAVAHEVAHHLAGDTGCADPRSAARAERRAEEWAAAALVDPAEWARATRAYEHAAQVADAVGVPPHAVAVYVGMVAGAPARA